MSTSTTHRTTAQQFHQMHWRSHQFLQAGQKLLHILWILWTGMQFVAQLHHKLQMITAQLVAAVDGIALWQQDAALFQHSFKVR